MNHVLRNIQQESKNKICQCKTQAYNFYATKRLDRA